MSGVQPFCADRNVQVHATVSRHESFAETLGWDLLFLDRLGAVELHRKLAFRLPAGGTVTRPPHSVLGLYVGSKVKQQPHGIHHAEVGCCN